MAATQTSPLLRYLHQLAVCGSVADVPDGPLLERFVHHRDEAAFAALMRRHGPMVLGVCSRVLRDDHAAEDAFQATFLVLAEKAGSLRQRQSLGPWLHGVALRTAQRARSDAARRRARESKAAIETIIEDPDDLVWRDLRPLLDDAVAALSEKYRVPFIRCYLQSETVAEVARQLGCPKGTIAWRLARAREQLRQRLSRRGVSLSLAALTTGLGEGELSVAMLRPELRRAVMTAVNAAIHRGTNIVVFTEIMGLIKGAFQIMVQMKYKMAVLLLLSFSVASGSVALFVRQTPAEQQAPNEAGRETTTAPQGRGKLYLKVYQVTELVVCLTPDPAPEKFFCLSPNPTPEKLHWMNNCRWGELVRLIENLIAPRSWDSRGGIGTLDFYPLTMALVVNQTLDVQNQVSDLLGFLHRLNDADRSRSFVATLIETKEGQAVLRRYVQARMAKKKKARK